MAKRILIVEDDDDIASIEKDYLEVSGYQVTVEENGTAGLTEALTGDYDLILLDVMLPGMDGFQIVRKLRDKVDIPIMMVTAKRTDIDKIRGLGFGADDYIEKPFSPGVLVAKVKSQLAQYERLKGKPEDRKRITISGITLESDTHRIWVRGEEKVLPNKEFQLLEFLMVHADVVYSRETLYTRIWGMDSLGNTATVPVHINRLREAVEEDPANPRHILTIWGVGYKFKP
ncbi:response regulator transcription factor [uncultured Dialister sp.]|jgi:DNA-binding response OmpR family regulator|uniref:response regulator transcription factor n=1 Tax=uncultured Dialister sp. TaxID=278064 RepID=UPI0025E7858A|nr:response regulator transcription factor [uncultured Dialister sp.]